MKRTLIHNATIVNEGQSVKGSVVIEDGRIAEVLTNWKPLSAPCDETIDATGCYLLPGIIDDHVHFRDPGLTHKADILTESRAAAAGGVTSIMDMPNTNPVTTTLDALNAKLDLLNEKCIVNHSCYFGATNDNYSEFGKLDKHRVCGIKLFMGSSTGNMLVDKMNSLLNIFNGTDMLIAAHCEDQETIKNNIAKYKEMFAGENDIPIGKHPYIRSSAACYASSERQYGWQGLPVHGCIFCMCPQPRNCNCSMTIHFPRSISPPKHALPISSSRSVTIARWAHVSSAILPLRSKPTAMPCVQPSTPA